MQYESVSRVEPRPQRSLEKTDREKWTIPIPRPDIGAVRLLKRFRSRESTTERMELPHGTSGDNQPREAQKMQFSQAARSRRERGACSGKLPRKAD
jgi:hypothetical protein